MSIDRSALDQWLTTPPDDDLFGEYADECCTIGNLATLTYRLTNRMFDGLPNRPSTNPYHSCSLPAVAAALGPWLCKQEHGDLAHWMHALGIVVAFDQWTPGESPTVEAAS